MTDQPVSPEQEFANAIHRYYDALMVAGFTKDQAFELAKDYHMRMVAESASRLSD